MKHGFTSLLLSAALVAASRPVAAQARVEPNAATPYNMTYVAGYVNDPSKLAHNLIMDDYSVVPTKFPSLLKILRSGRVGLNLRNDGDPECWLNVGRGLGNISLDDIGGAFDPSKVTSANPLVPNGGACIGFNAVRQATFDGYFRMSQRNVKDGGSVIWANNDGALSFSTIGDNGAQNNWVSSQAVATTYCRLKINPDGKIQIGRGLTSASPHFANYKLAVDGKVVAQSIYVVNSTDWADFVFEPTYQLMPLPDLEQYLRVHKHLPSVPSAQEVKTDGIDLGTMQVRLLQQLEELTLRVIELDKQNRRLQAEVRALSTK